MVLIYYILDRLYRRVILLLINIWRKEKDINKLRNNWNYWFIILGNIRGLLRNIIRV
jgi:hypothetical protein